MEKNSCFPTVWGQLEQKPNTELCFLCEIKKSKNVVLELIAKDIYNLFINGSFVSYGPARAAKNYSRIERILLDPYLTEETNELAVYVQSNASRSCYVVKEEPLFGAVIYEKERVIADTTDFECYLMTDKLRKVERMSSQRGFVEIYQLGKNREYVRQSHFPRLHTILVEAPEILERGVSAAKNKIEQAQLVKSCGVSRDPEKTWVNDFTKLLDSGTKLDAYARSECECVLSRELLEFNFQKNIEGYELISFLYEFKKCRCGKFKIHLKAEKESQLWLLYDDVLVDGNIRFNREQIIHGMKWSLQKGNYILYSQEVYSAKYIQLIIDGAIEIEKIEMIRIENPDMEKWLLPPMDQELQLIVEAAENSFKHNAYDIFTDTPSRERAGWLCDSYFMAKAEKFFTGKNLVEKNFLENFLLFENEVFHHDGIMPMCYPAEPASEEDYIPAWILWYILELEDCLERTKDEAFLQKHTGRLRKILEFFESYENEYGLLENLEGWVFLEWSQASEFTAGVNFPYNMLYADALRAAAGLLRDESLYEKSVRLKKIIREMSFDGSLFFDQAVRENDKLVLKEHISELCQIYAIYFEIIENDREYEENFKSRFLSTAYGERIHPTALFTGEILRLMILFEMKEYELLLRECKERFLGMAKMTGTIWEFFEKTASCNHGFGAIVGKLICESVMALQKKERIADEGN